MAGEPSVLVACFGGTFVTVGLAGDDNPRYQWRVHGGLDGQEHPTFLYSHFSSHEIDLLAAGESTDVDNGSGTEMSMSEFEQHCRFATEAPMFIGRPAESVLIGMHVRGSVEERLRQTECCFSCADVKCVFLIPEPVLSLYASGRTTGLVIDVGAREVRCVPVYEGHVIWHGVRCVPRGLLDVSERLASVDPIKTVDKYEKIALIDRAWDLLLEESNADCIEKTAEEAACIPDAAWSAISACDLDIRMNLGRNIVLHGRGSLYQKLGDRLRERLHAFVPSWQIVVVTMPQLSIGGWIGGSILGSLHDFNLVVISRQEWEEESSALDRYRLIRARFDVDFSAVSAVTRMVKSAHKK